MPKSSPEELMVEEILCPDCQQVFYDWWDAALRVYTSLEVASENFRKELNGYRLGTDFFPARLTRKSVELGRSERRIEHERNDIDDQSLGRWFRRILYLYAVKNLPSHTASYPDCRLRSLR